MGRRDKPKRMGWLLVSRARAKTKPSKHASLLAWAETGNWSNKPRRPLQTSRGFRPMSRTSPTCLWHAGWVGFGLGLQACVSGNPRRRRCCLEVCRHMIGFQASMVVLRKITQFCFFPPEF
ncbi:hypothetical protein ACFX2I_022242 [Malus domestica]